MKPVLIFGAGQVAQVFAEYLKTNGYTVAAFIVNASHWEPATFIDGVPVVAFENVGSVTFIPAHDYQFVVGMSFKGLNAPRAEKYAAMLAKGYEPLTFIDRHARVAPSARIGRGSFIMDGNVIQTGAEIGENCVLWSGNHLGHHSKVGDHVWISSHVVVSGAVEIGERSFLGVNVSVRDNIKVGARCVLGMNAIIDKDCEADGVYKPVATERSRVPSSRLRGI